MKIVPIFAPRLYAFHHKGKKVNELERLLDSWNNPVELTKFIIENKKDIEGYTNEEIIDQLIEDANAIDDKIEWFKSKPKQSLDTFFQPLNNLNTGLLNLNKQKGRLNYFRLYAIKIEPNCFVITGGGIKFSKVHRMQDRPHLKAELAKLNKCGDYLKEKGVFDKNSFHELLDEEL